MREFLARQWDYLAPPLKQAFADFRRHNGQWLAAAISYFAVFSVAPLVIVVTQVTAVVLGGHRGAFNEIYGYLEVTSGKQAADGVAVIVTSVLSQKHVGSIAQIVAWVVFVVAAMGLFGSLQEAVDVTFEVGPKNKGFVQALRSRAFCFGLVLGTALLLLVALAANTLLTIATLAMTRVFPFFPVLMKGIDFVLSFVVFTGLFALLFKYLPERRTPWRDIWPGAAVTSLMFVIGQFFLGWYLAGAGISSAYGAFGSLVAFMIWVNYSVQIVLLGAAFVHAFADR